MYSAELASVDFLRAPEDARKTINAWVKEQTGGERGRRWPSAGPFLPSARLPLRGPSPPSPLGLTLGSTPAQAGQLSNSGISPSGDVNMV